MSKEAIREILNRTLHVEQSGFINGNGIGQDQYIAGIDKAVSEIDMLFSPKPTPQLNLWERMRRKSFWEDNGG